jgi:hypothetical protein
LTPRFLFVLKLVVVMADKALIEKTLKDLGYGKWLGKGEIKELPSILWEDELPEKIIEGHYSDLSPRVLVVTNKRLILIHKSFWSSSVEDFSFNKITTIQYSKGMLRGGMEIYASGNRTEIRDIKLNEVGPFAEYIRTKITKTPTSESATVSLVFAFQNNIATFINM